MSQSKILMYTTGWCPYCQRARNLFASRNLTFEEIDVEADAKLRAAMVARSGGRSSVPQIFIGDTHVGGFDDLNALHGNGALDNLLEDAK